MNQKTKLILFGLGLYLIVAGASFALFSVLAKEEGLASPLVEEGMEGEMVAFTGPRTEFCPLNGVGYTKEQKEIWEQRRPLLVMIENHEDSRPQSGLSRADIIYEVVAEGGITRLMGVYYCQATEPYSRNYDLGPVRSARTYFLDWASEYSDYPLYVHVGGAGLCHDVTVDPRAKALCQIEEYGWKDREHWSDLDQFALPYSICRREPERTGKTVATEHTMYCDTRALWQKAEERGLKVKSESGDSWDENFVSWKFKEEEDLNDRGGVSSISFDFWEGYSAYGVKWTYDKEGNQYLRSNGGSSHNDFLDQKQLAAKVVVVQFAKETGPVDDHKHLLYKTTGAGKALVFQDGRAIEGSWSKGDREERTIFKDSRGKEIEFNPGLIWIEVLPAGNQVDYESV